MIKKLICGFFGHRWGEKMLLFWLGKPYWVSVCKRCGRQQVV